MKKTALKKSFDKVRQLRDPGHILVTQIRKLRRNTYHIDSDTVIWTEIIIEKRK